jgi:hypothetical protein
VLVANAKQQRVKLRPVGQLATAAKRARNDEHGVVLRRCIACGAVEWLRLRGWVLSM